MNQGYATKSPGYYPGGAVVSQGSYGPVEERKEKKMGWFTRWFDRKCRESWERARNEPSPPISINAVERGPRLDANGLSMNIYGADGGTVLEFRHYDYKTDRHDNTLHVISQSENFEERVAQAITMELLRKGIAK